MSLLGLRAHSHFRLTLAVSEVGLTFVKGVVGIARQHNTIQCKTRQARELWKVLFSLPESQNGEGRGLTRVWLRIGVRVSVKVKS